MAPSTSVDVRKLSKRAKMLGIKGYQKMSPKELKAAVKREEDSFEDIAAPRKKKAKPGKAKPAAFKSKPAPVEKPKAKTKKVAKNGTTKTKASKPVSKKATKPASKTKAKSSKPKENLTGDPANPFRTGSNLWRMAEELLKGGKRSDMIKRLKKAMSINPWSKDKEEDLDTAINKRLLLTAAAMEKDYGFTQKREGRGTSGTIRLVPPGAKGSKKAAKSKPAAKSSTSKKSSKPSSGKKSAGQKPSSKANSKKTTSKGKATKKVKR